MPVRVRLTILYVILLALALSTASVGGYVIAERRIYGSLDDSLRVRSEALVKTFQDVQAPLTAADIVAKRAELEEQSSADLVFQIRDSGGSVLYSSTQPASGSLPASDRPDARPHFSTREAKGQDLRILYQPLSLGGLRVGTIEVAQSLKTTKAALSEIRDVFIVTGIALAVLTSVSAYTLAGNALRPVRQVSALAREIESTATFSRRLDVPKTRDEVSELIMTFNAMIQRVEQTLLDQRSFLADSSHELRRPLTVIRTNIDVLASAGLPDDERRQCVQEMGGQAELMSKLLADLLLLARERSQTISRTPLDFAALCEEAVSRQRARDDRHELIASVDERVRLTGDRERLAQMVSNLLDNAAQYTPEGGQIELRLRRLDGRARLEVSDTGIGIPQEDIRRVFDRFYRGEGARAAYAEGVGLGLAIVKYVAEAHGGAVGAKSEPGKGSRFTVDLPLSDG
ncbi:MAG TPA: HAMP domain-containing sensor histidine kinase [Dehalococcoidia bacterium]|nr:HAMP domain-containing sensor histidine kinase [Dehalococcoidia bacterium]